VMLSRILAILLLVPYITTVDPDSVSDNELSIAIAAGGGSYAEVSRDCNGNVTSVKDHPYGDVAGSVRYRTSVLELGLTGGQTSGIKESSSLHFVEEGGPGNFGHWIENSPGPLAYMTPSVGLTTTYFGLELGYLFSLNDHRVGLNNDAESRGMPSGMIRIGRYDKTNFSAGLARNFPLISGGGLIDVGLSSPVGSGGSRLWYGIGGYPYDGLVFSLKGDIRISDHFALTPTIHLKGGDAFEYGWSIGGRASF
jgi:hypothetical protein